MSFINKIRQCIALYSDCIIYATKKKGCNEKCIETIIEAVAMVTHPEKCIRRPVQIVGKNVKFPLNQVVQDLFTARTAIRNIGHQGDIKSLSFFSFFGSMIYIPASFIRNFSW